MAIGATRGIPQGARRMVATVLPVARALTTEELVLLGDCYYLPYEEGAEAESLFRQARALLLRKPSEWGADATDFQQQAARLRDVCAGFQNSTTGRCSTRLVAGSGSSARRWTCSGVTSNTTPASDS